MDCDHFIPSSFAGLLFGAVLSMGCTSNIDTANETETLQLSKRLESGQVRAGVVADEEALFGGVSAEGAVGDIKIYNDRVQFVIQAPGTSHYYVEAGGSVIDADIVRPFGQPGQDLIDESSAMVGLGRMFHADTVEVVNDGTNGEAAIVRATGGVGTLTLLSGSLESFGLILDREVKVTNEYTLEPDSWLLKMNTHVRWDDQSTLVQLADLAFVAADVADFYEPNFGYQTDEFQEEFGWTGIVGQRNEAAMAFLQGEADGTFRSAVLLDTLLDLGPLLMGPGPSVTLDEGDELQWSRYLGVGPDMASVTGEWLERQGTAVETIAGTVKADDQAVPGARVHVQDESGQVITMAVADEEGRYTAKVPANQNTTVFAESRGPGIYYDRAPGAGWYSPYAANRPSARTLSSIASGALPTPFSPGHGVGTMQAAGADTELQLTPSGLLAVQIADGGPATVRVEFLAGDPVAGDAKIIPARPSGYHAWLYIRDGQGSIPLEPGPYRVVVHRGTTHEAHEEQVQIESSGTVQIDANLIQSVNTEGLWSFDPHTHAAPSADGSISMTGRLTVHAAHGVDIHVGTDHDHIADYRVLLEPLGLQNHLASIVADEVSPIRRGHHNVYPLEVDPNAMNGGATRWYDRWVDFETTDDFYSLMRTMKSDGDVLVQANHPTSRSGLFANANYSTETGEIGTTSRWSADFDAFELLNDGGYRSVFPYYLDMLNRGMRPTPVGVSDSHSHRGGVGENLTWLPIDISNIRELTNDHIRTAVREGGTVVSHGPLVVATIDDVWAPGTSHVGAVDVHVDIRTPSWMDVTALRVYENGTEIMTLDASSNPVLVSLQPESDAVYVLVAEGSDDMSPVYPGLKPWAATQAFYIDADGDGWQPPLPPLNLR